MGYRLAWARTYLKKFGALENSARGVWALSSEGLKVQRVNPQEVVRYVRELDRQQRPKKRLAKADLPPDAPDEYDAWREA